MLPYMYKLNGRNKFMSTEANTKLIEEARELAEYWTGTQHEQRILLAIKRDDLDYLYECVRTARYEMLRREYSPEEAADVY